MDQSGCAGGDCTARSYDSDLIQIPPPTFPLQFAKKEKKIQSWIFNRPPFERVNIFHPWPIFSDKNGPYRRVNTECCLNCKQRAVKFYSLIILLLWFNFDKTPRGWRPNPEAGFPTRAAASVFIKKSACSQAPLTAAALNRKSWSPWKPTTKQKNESFSGLNWFAGNLHGTEAPHMQ